MIPLHTKIKFLRERLNLTQLEFLKTLSTIESNATISKWESGERLPNILQLAELASVYHVSCDYLIAANECFTYVELPYIDLASIPYKSLYKQKYAILEAPLQRVEMLNSLPIWKYFIYLNQDDLEEFGVAINDKIIVCLETEVTKGLVLVYMKQKKNYQVRNIVTYDDDSVWFFGAGVNSPINKEESKLKIIGKIHGVI